MARARPGARAHPLFLHLAGERVVVIGGGAVAERKVEALVETGARVTVISPEMTGRIRQLADGGSVRVEARPYARGDLHGVRLAYAATDEEAVNRAVRAEADAEGTWLNVADGPELCDFYSPAVVRRGDLTVAVSTGGASPVLARRLRDSLARVLGPEFAAALDELRAIRDNSRAEGRGAATEGQRIDGIIDRLLPAGSLQIRPGAVGDEPVEPHVNLGPAGTVFLVGAGPGDPGLITVKGLQALARADVVFYDALVESDLLDQCRADARRVFVGKRQGSHTLPQDEINRALVEEAQAGHTVVRLKGGDPFIFGRGGEEATALAAAGVPYEVVPGVSAGTGAPACAGIPLTHRAYSSELVFLTGHENTGDAGTPIDWARYAPGVTTLVIFMGRERLDEIATALIAHGRDPDCPAAVIFAGTTRRQRTIVAPLKEVAARAASCASTDTALVVVGEVVRMREGLGRGADRDGD